MSDQTVAALLDDLGPSLQANRKTKEGQDHADRDAQFEYISRQVRAFQEERPTGHLSPRQEEGKHRGFLQSRAGVALPSQAGGGPCQGLSGQAAGGKAIPEGQRNDLSRNEGWVSVCVYDDTAEFAGVSIWWWWEEMGSLVYPGARRLLITPGSMPG